MAAENQRNFRSAYLEKVVSKGADEKKSLDHILNEKHVDIRKLRQFCMSNKVPATCRSYVWQILLGILPTHQDVSDFVMRQRREQYEDLLQTLTVMKRIDDNTPTPHALLKMYLVEQGRLPLNEHKLLANPSNEAFVALCEGISQVEDDKILCYWISAKLFRMQEKYKATLSVMKDHVESVLKKEDPSLHAHLTSAFTMDVIPTTRWFTTMFADALPDSAFERICDHVIGGSFLFLVCVAVSALIAVRRPLMTKNVEDLATYLKKFPEESDDITVMKASELWKKYGHLLQPSAQMNINSDRGHVPL